MRIIVLLLLTPALVFASPLLWAFEATLDGSDFGSHDFTVEKEGDVIKVNSKAKYDYYLAFVRVFKYRHEAREVWKDGCLVELESETDNNGDDEFVKTLSSREKLRLKTHEADEKVIPGCASAYSYWDIDLLRKEMLVNPQTGVQNAVELKRLGDERIKYKGKEFDTEKYQLLVDGDKITLWYTKQDKVWVKLRSELKNDKVLEYIPKRISALDQVS